MSYLAQGLNSGFRLGSDAVQAKKERELREQEQIERRLTAAAERDLRRELAQKGIDADAPVKGAQAANLNASAEETRGMLPVKQDEGRARARANNAHADRTETLTPYEAAELGEQTLGRSLDNQKKSRVMDTEVSRARAALEGDTLTNAARELELDEAAKKHRAGPMATIERDMGDGTKAKFSTPAGDLQKQLGESRYRSPYAEKIAHLGDQIATQQAEMEGGDQRTGLFNLKSRKDEVGRAQSQRTRLQALEIQDMVNSGTIPPEEGDRRAARLLNRFAPPAR